jgi:glycosyltransferase involved in cell wall biosynthesis
MSVYNGEPYAGQAIESILAQTFDDFEFIIVDDGSTDGTADTLESWAGQDRRLKLLWNEGNLGLIASLNKGVCHAEGEYIARQDADDRSSPQRLALQVDFLDKHPEVGVLGTWMANVDKFRRRVWRTPTAHGIIKWSLLFGTAMVHSSVMLRRSLLEDAPFRPGRAHAEDYDLWVRLCERTKMANLPRCLYWRRLHDQRVSVRFRREQEETVVTIIQENMTKILGHKVSRALVEKLRKAGCDQLLNSVAEMRKVADLYMSLYQRYGEQNRLQRAEQIEIARDAASRIARLAVNHMTQWPAACLKVWCLAARLNYRSALNVIVARWGRRLSTMTETPHLHGG